MLNDRQIEALKNGAYGITRNGRKCRYVGAKSGNHRWAVFDRQDPMILSMISTYRDFESDREYQTSSWDIVGLWEDFTEPFDLEKALNGDLVISLNMGEKGVVTRSKLGNGFVIEYTSGAAETLSYDEVFEELRMGKPSLEEDEE